MTDSAAPFATARLALVTGGIRGSGGAISIALRDAGYQVIANYADNHQRNIYRRAYPPANLMFPASMR